MSSAIQLGLVTLLPLKEAVDFVPYTRDYVARLAREGKVVAAQIDRQWFVDVASLQNFYANSSIEESVRSRHLSSLRKRDLEIREMYQARLSGIEKRQRVVKRVAAAQTGLVVLCGVVTGLFLFAAHQMTSPDRLSAIIQIPWDQFFSRSTGVAAVFSATTALPEVTYTLSETDESFAIKNGIVVIPQASTASTSVADFFSDPVSVQMTSTTTGSIRNLTTGEALPFVRVPTETTITAGGNEAQP